MRNSVRNDNMDLIKKYQIPLTGFYWRYKKAEGDQEKLIELLEDYSRKKAQREKRKANPIIKLSDETEVTHLKSKDEYYIYLWEYIKNTVYQVRPKYFIGNIGKTVDNEDIVNDLMYQVMRPSKDRPFKVKLALYDEFKYEIGMILKPVELSVKSSDNKDFNIEIIELDKKGKPSKVKMAKDNAVLTDFGDTNELYPTHVWAETFTINNKPIIVKGTSMYDKYVENPSIVETTKGFIAFITNNWFKDYIANIKNTTPQISIYKPINDTDNVVLGDMFGCTDEDPTVINEFLEFCGKAKIKDVTLDKVISLVIKGYTFAEACKMFNLQTKKVRETLEKLGAKDILGGTEV